MCPQIYGSDPPLPIMVRWLQPNRDSISKQSRDATLSSFGQLLSHQERVPKLQDPFSPSAECPTPSTLSGPRPFPPPYPTCYLPAWACPSMLACRTLLSCLPWCWLFFWSSPSSPHPTGRPQPATFDTLTSLCTLTSISMYLEYRNTRRLSLYQPHLSAFFLPPALTFFLSDFGSFRYLPQNLGKPSRKRLGCMIPRKEYIHGS